MLIDIQIPKRARWVAQDASGVVWWFTHKPQQNKEVLEWYFVKGDCGCIIRNATPPADWTKTLKRVER